MQIDRNPQRVAVIKTGYQETFNELDVGGEVSLGDVLRTTPLLHLLKGAEVHWFVSPQGRPLLEGASKIHQLHSIDGNWNPFDPSSFDLVINLEKDPQILKHLRALDRRKLVGFTESSHSDYLLRISGQDDPISISDFKARQKAGGARLWQDWLFGLFQKQWNCEGYIFSPPETALTSDVGLNWKIGNKWPSKDIALSFWDETEKVLAAQYSVTWQRGFEDLAEYIRWVSSCRVIVTNDSLGLHLAIALGKKVCALFGPTPSEEVFLYGRGQKIIFEVPSQYHCLPCSKPHCFQPISCTQFAQVKQVQNVVVEALGRKATQDARETDLKTSHFSVYRA